MLQILAVVTLVAQTPAAWPGDYEWLEKVVELHGKPAQKLEWFGSVHGRAIEDGLLYSWPMKMSNIRGMPTQTTVMACVRDGKVNATYGSLNITYPNANGISWTKMSSAYMSFGLLKKLLKLNKAPTRFAYSGSSSARHHFLYYYDMGTYAMRIELLSKVPATVLEIKQDFATGKQVRTNRKHLNLEPEQCIVTGISMYPKDPKSMSLKIRYGGYTWLD